MAEDTKVWITPTSYGAVFTQNVNREQTRIFIDKIAVDRLLSDKPYKIIQMLENKGMDIDHISALLQGFKKDAEVCRTIIKDNDWGLFSLHPLQISIQIVNYCNAGCDFCYANAPEKEENLKLDLETIKELKDHAADHGIKIGISGGEPTLHPDIYDILRYRKNEVFDTLITNLSTDIQIGRLIETEVDLIQISLHGHKAHHDRMLKINGLYESVFEKMRELAPHLDLATNTVITPENIRSIDMLIGDLLSFQNTSKKKLRYVRLVAVMPSGSGKDRYSNEPGFLKEVNELLARLHDDHPEINFETPLLHPNPYEYYTNNELKHCPAGSTVCVIRADGYVSPCNQFIETGIISKRSVLNNDFHSIWLNDPVLSRMRKGIAESEGDSCDECAYLILKEKDTL